MNASADLHYRRALKHLDAQDWSAAEEELRQALDLEPRHADASTALARTLAAAGDLPRAEELFVRSLEVRPEQPDALVELGLLLAQRGANDRARETIYSALRLAGGDAVSCHRLGTLSRDAGEPGEAEFWFRRGLSLAPRDARCNASLGFLLLKERRDAEALDHLAAAAAVRPPLPWVNARLGMLFADGERWAEALAAYEVELQYHPDNAHAWGLRGAALFAVGRNAEAIAAFRQAALMEPDQPLFHVELGLALADAGEAEEAVAALGRAIELAPSSVDAWSSLGLVHYRLENWADAEHAYREALRLGAQDPETLFQFAVALEQVGRTEEAAEQFRAVVARDADRLDAHQHLARLAYGRGALAEAAAAYTGIVRLHPKDETSWLNLALIQAELGHDDDARIAWRESLSLNPFLALALDGFGVDLALQKQWDAAARVFRLMTIVDPESAEAPYRLGIALSKAGRPEEAVGAYREAVRRHPWNADAYNNLGSICDRLGRHQDAVQALEHAAQLESDDPEVLCNLGVAYGHLGRRKDEIQAYRRALHADPRSPHALLYLGEALLDAEAPAEAAEALERGAALQPAEPEIHLLHALALCRAGRAAEADVPAARAVALEGGLDAFVKRAVICALRKDWDGVSELARLGRQAGSRDAVLPFLAGLASIESGDEREGLDAFRAAIGSRPTLFEERFDTGLGVALAGRVRSFAALGTVLLENDRAAAAEDAFRLALQVDAEDGPARFGLGRTLLHQDRPREAMREFLAAARRVADPAPALFHVGVILEELEGWSVAEEYFQKAIAARPDFVSPYLELARRHVDAGRSGEALRLLEAARRSCAPSPALDAGFARAQLAAGQVADALARIDAAIAAGGATREFVRLKLEAVARAGRFDEAAVLADQLGDPDRLAPDDASLVAAVRLLAATPLTGGARIADGSADDLAARGEALARVGRPGEAEPALESAIELDPGHDRAALVLAQLRADAGAHDEARAVLEAARARGARGLEIDEALARIELGDEEFDRAAELAANVVRGDREHGEGWALYGRALAGRGDHDPEAIHALQEALRRQPGDVGVLHALGLCKFRRGDLAGAVASFERALVASTQWVRERYADAIGAHGTKGAALAGGEDLARAFLAQGLLLDAGRVLTDLQQSGPPRAETLFLEGKTKVALGRYEEAESAFKRSLEIDRGRTETWLELGAFYAQQGRWADANRALDALTSRFPDLPDGHVALGIARLEAGERDAALTSFRRAIESEPRHALAHQWLGRAHLVGGEKNAARAVYRTLREIDRRAARQLFYEIHR